MTLLCWLLGLLALASQPQALPADFTRGAIERGQAAVDPGPDGPYFLGIEWLCEPGDGEVCYAGLELNFDDAAGLVTGP